MNLLITDSRQLLPSDKRKLIEQKEKTGITRRRVSVLVSICLLVVLGLILFPQVIKKTASTVFGSYKVDPVITEKLAVNKIQSKDLASILQQNDIDATAIAPQQSQLAEIIVQPSVNEKSVKFADSRILTLRNYLINRGSPMVGSASTFIQVADEYKFDWRLLP